MVTTSADGLVSSQGQLVANASHMSTLPEMATLRSELWGLLQSAEQCQPLKGLLESLFCDHFADLYSPSERNDIFMQVIEKSKPPLLVPCCLGNHILTFR